MQIKGGMCPFIAASRAINASIFYVSFKILSRAKKKNSTENKKIKKSINQLLHEIF